MTDPETHLSAAEAPAPGAKMTWGAQLDLLRKLAITLHREIQRLGKTHNWDMEKGVDFYEEVRRFEIDIINCALTSTRGHQGQAARLLGLNATTLNSKLKQYGITVMRQNFATDEHELVVTVGDREIEDEANSGVVQ